MAGGTTLTEAFQKTSKSAASYRWRPWQPRDVYGFARVFSIPGRRLCLWRTPFQPQTIRTFAVLFHAAWTHEKEASEVFASFGTPYAFSLVDEHERYVDFAVVMVYGDGSAAISGLASDELAGHRVAVVKALAARGRELFGLERIMLADIPGVRQVAVAAGLPVKVPPRMSREERTDFLNLLYSIVPDVS